MLKVAVVGSREFPDDDIIKYALDRLVEREGPICIVSGGARGADTWGERWAKRNGAPTIIHLPDWDRLGRKAGFVRNEYIARDADIVLAFTMHDGRSGTRNTIAHANRMGKPMFEYRYSDDDWHLNPQAEEWGARS